MVSCITCNVVLHAIWFGGEGEPHWTAPRDPSVTCFLVPDLPLITLLLADTISSQSPASTGRQIQVGSVCWELRFHSPEVHLSFLCTEGTLTEHGLGAVTPIIYSGPTRHPSAFSHCTATLKVTNALIQITKILKLSLTDILKFVLFAFSTSVAATLHKHVIFASNVLIKRKCKAYTCLNHEINTHISV